MGQRSGRGCQVTWPNPGIYFGIPERKYHAVGFAQDVVSKSLLWDFYPNPHKWFHGPRKATTSAMSWGSLVDCLLTTPAEFSADFVLSKYDEFRSNESKAWKAAMEAEGMTVIKQADLDSATQAALITRTKPFVADILDRATFQASICLPTKIGEYETTQLVKGRLDIIPDAGGPFGEWVFDLKTTASLAKIGNTIADYGYHAQAGLYLDLYNGACGIAHKRTRWGFIFVESEPPYECAVVELDPSEIDAGRDWISRALSKFARCKAENNWPSPWEDEIKIVGRPAWARKGES